VFVSTLLLDLRYAARMLRKDLGFALVAALTLAIGIGATTAMFTVVNGVLLKPLPYRDAERLVLIRERLPKIGPQPLSNPAPDVLRYQAQTHSLEGVAGYQTQPFDLVANGTPERITGGRVMWNTFPLLGVQPILGRTFTADEDQPDKHLAVISYAFWQRLFGGSREVLGKTLNLDRNLYTLVGVMPPGFAFPLKTYQSQPISLWVPMGFTAEEKAAVADNFDYEAVARLKPGVPLAQAQADVEVVAGRIHDEYPATVRNEFQMQGVVLPLQEDALGAVRAPLLILLGAVAFVLLIATANVANLLLARSSGRRRELAIRMALGAGSRRLFSQLLAESLLLAVIGGAFGMLLALWGTQALLSLVPANVPRLQTTQIDWHVLTFALAVSLLTGIIFGMAPAFMAGATNLNQSLKEGGRTGTQSRQHQRLRSLFVVTQVALALVLLVGAGLLIRSFQRVLAVDPGFRPQHVVTASVALPFSQYKGAQRRQANLELLRRLRQIPGAESVGASTDLPLEGGWSRIFSVQGYVPPPDAGLNTCKHSVVMGDYLQAMGIPLVRGRFFSDADNQENAKVVIISESIARRYFAGRDPIGGQLKWGPAEGSNPWMTVVGVVGEVKQGALDVTTQPHTYEPYLQLEPGFGFGFHFAVRTSGDPAAAASSLRAAVWGLDSQLPVTQLRTMEQLLDATNAPRRFNMILAAAFAAAALLLAAIGLYGVIAYSVSQRTHEIGIRLTLGAQPSDVLGMVLRWGGVLSLIGIAVGAAASLLSTRLLSGFLFGVKATDPLTFVGVAMLLALVAVLASFIPAHRATKVDPMVALRYE